eukprot:Em0004g812a
MGRQALIHLQCASVNRHNADPVTGGITFKFITTEEWGNEETLLQERSSKAKTIAGTQRLHCFVPVDTSTLQVLEYSASCDQSCYVTAIYDGAWWVACVTGTNPEMQEVTLSFLHPRGPSRSFLYPHKADILTVHISVILTFVEPTTYPGQTYTLTDNEMDRATQALQDRK